jgi:hypothetical protein
VDVHLLKNQTRGEVGREVLEQKHYRAISGRRRGQHERRTGVLMHRDSTPLPAVLDFLWWKLGPPVGFSTFGLLTGIWWPAMLVIIMQTLDAVADWIPRFKRKLKRIFR